MLQRVLTIGLLGVLPVLGCGCPCCVLVAGQGRGAEAAALGAQTRVPTAEEAKTYELGTLVGKVQGQYVSGVDKGGAPVMCSCGPRRQQGVLAG